PAPASEGRSKARRARSLARRSVAARRASTKPQNADSLCYFLAIIQALTKERKMRLLFIITSFLLFSAAHADAQDRAAAPGSCDLPHMPGVATQQLMSRQRPRTYRLFVPPGYDGHQRLPLVLDLHGSGGSSEGQARNSGLEMVSASERFIVATLDAEGGRWNVPVQSRRADDVAYGGDVIRQ